MDFKSELLKQAKKIEDDAKDLQDKLAQGEDILAAANALFRDSSTLTFILGGMYGAEDNMVSANTNATVVSNPNNTIIKSNNYNVRDCFGRFVHPNV